MKKIIILIVALLIIVVGMFYAIKHAGGVPTGSAGVSIISPVSATDWTRGNAAAKVVLVEYSDFQCPACRAYDPVVRQLVKDLGDKFVLVYRHFPLPQHQNAKAAIVVAEAAGKQGKFWEMHDMLFDHQNEWAEASDPNASFLYYANTLKLNIDQWNTDRKSAAVTSLIDQSIAEATRTNLSYTPTFFLNGTRIENPQSYEAFKSLVTDAINK